MKSERSNTKIVLIDLQYSDSINSFEYFYGENTSYHELEQRSYVEFKDAVFVSINKNIKFRKYGRIGHVLTIKADMLETEIEKFKKMLDKNEIKFIYDWAISNITIIKDAEHFNKQNSYYYMKEKLKNDEKNRQLDSQDGVDSKIDFEEEEDSAELDDE